MGQSGIPCSWLTFLSSLNQLGCPFAKIQLVLCFFGADSSINQLAGKGKGWVKSIFNAQVLVCAASASNLRSKICTFSLWISIANSYVKRIEKKWTHQNRLRFSNNRFPTVTIIWQKVAALWERCTCSQHPEDLPHPARGLGIWQNTPYDCSLNCVQDNYHNYLLWGACFQTQTNYDPFQNTNMICSKHKMICKITVEIGWTMSKSAWNRNTAIVGSCHNIIQHPPPLTSAESHGGSIGTLSAKSAWA